MYWLFLLFAIAAFLFALSTPQLPLLLIGLVVALVFFLLWIKGLYVARFGSVVAEPRRALHPAELQKLREQLQPPTSSARPPPEKTPDPS